ncbi:hypothetical protein A2Y83_00355 [Candidatus Falkowbacteria bacterium RBG_13_39_14]|uniref:Uncharacterized protein n=1 Tax=Candidatus Falkowbacteria bacterium RBG_13_39_14 TaxID=1797985 RepID=A0A1F5S885_9BACT|nr:MAG: hypothetical protein A2Y83_00355 [Candidatus Falkowbacteria bacterium RBG_13_39_14]
MRPDLPAAQAGAGRFVSDLYDTIKQNLSRPAVLRGGENFAIEYRAKMAFTPLDIYYLTG